MSELTAAQADLPAANGQGTYGRATKEAASALLAHVYLNAEVYTGTPHYAEALAAAQAAIAGPFSLDPSFQHIFLADNNTSPEIIFPIIQDGKTTETWGGGTFLVHAACGGSMNPAAYGVNGCWFGLRLKAEAYNRFAVDDPRRAFFLTDRPDGGRHLHHRLQQGHPGAQVLRTSPAPAPPAPTRRTSTPTSRCSASATCT